MSLARINIMRLDHLAAKGFDPRIHSADFYFNLAVEIEETKNIIGPFDPAFAHYAERGRLAFEAALMAEELNNG